MDGSFRIPFEYIMVNLLGQTYLVLVYFNFGSGVKRCNNLGDRLYNVILFANFSLLAVDSLAYFLNGLQWPHARLANLIACTVLYFLYPIMYTIWPAYCEYQLFSNLERFKRRLPLTVLLLFLLIAGTIISWFTPFYFYITADNQYIRGPLYSFHFMLGVSQTVYAFFLTLKEAKSDVNRIHRKRNRSLLIYPLFPMIGAFFQYAIANLSTIWLGTVLSFLYSFFNLQSAQITQDPLTSLSNRRHFDSYLEQMTLNFSQPGVLFLLMIDLNDFKQINDSFGHLTGDEALKHVSRVLIKALPRNDFLARIGGDEFAIVGIRGNTALAEAAAKTIQNELDQFNASVVVPYTLQLSIGCATMTKDTPLTAAEMVNRADKRMYSQKKHGTDPH